MLCSIKKISMPRNNRVSGLPGVRSRKFSVSVHKKADQSMKTSTKICWWQKLPIQIQHKDNLWVCMECMVCSASAVRLFQCPNIHYHKLSYMVPKCSQLSGWVGNHYPFMYGLITCQFISHYVFACH